MKKIFLDADVIIDFLLGREPFVNEVNTLMSLAERDMISCCISSLTMSHAYYFMRKQIGTARANKGIAILYEILEILTVDDNTIKLAINSGFKDFEDAIQYHCAIADGLVEVIVTRNHKDFKNSRIPVMSPKTVIGII